MTTPIGEKSLVSVACLSEEGPRMLTEAREQEGRRVENAPPERGTDQGKGALYTAYRKDCWIQRPRYVYWKSVARDRSLSRADIHTSNQPPCVDKLKRLAKGDATRRGEKTQRSTDKQAECACRCRRDARSGKKFVTAPSHCVTPRVS